MWAGLIQALAFMKALVSLGLAPLLLLGCAKNDSPPSEPSDKAVLPACLAYGGFAGRVCPVSIYALIASPTTYYGRTIAFNGYVHKSRDGTIIVYPSREAAARSDLASSVLCSSGKESCESYVGKYAEIFGDFTDKTEPDFFFKPVGTIQLAHVRSVKNPAER